VYERATSHFIYRGGEFPESGVIEKGFGKKGRNKGKKKEAVRRQGEQHYCPRDLGGISNRKGPSKEKAKPEKESLEF